MYEEDIPSKKALKMDPIILLFSGVAELLVAAHLSKRDILMALLLALTGTALIISSVNPIF